MDANLNDYRVKNFSSILVIVIPSETVNLL